MLICHIYTLISLRMVGGFEIDLFVSQLLLCGFSQGDLLVNTEILVSILSNSRNKKHHLGRCSPFYLAEAFSTCCMTN